MANYGYVRVSTAVSQKKVKKVQDRYEEVAKQDYERQRYILASSGVEVERIFEEHVSGGKKGDQRKAFNEMLSCLQEGDVVYFTETSRFGRNYKDNFEILDILTLEKRVSVHFLSNNIHLDGGAKLNPYSWMTLSTCFIFDEFQKRQIGYNTSNKLKALKEQGVRLGAPCTISQETKDEAMRLYYKDGLSQNQISKKLGISRTIIAKQIRTLEGAV